MEWLAVVHAPHPALQVCEMGLGCHPLSGHSAQDAQILQDIGVDNDGMLKELLVLSGIQAALREVLSGSKRVHNA